MSGHVEFPELSPEARAALDRGYEANGLILSTVYKYDRVRQAAFLREAMKRACEAKKAGRCCRWDALQFIAENLHCPPPPPPTLAQARAADLDTPEGRAAVRAFLATLGEGVQP